MFPLDLLAPVRMQRGRERGDPVGGRKAGEARASVYPGEQGAGGSLGRVVTDGPAYGGEIRTGHGRHSKGSTLCPQRACQLLSSQQERPLPQALGVPRVRHSQGVEVGGSEGDHLTSRAEGCPGPHTCPTPPTTGALTTPATAAGSQGRTGQGLPLGQQRVSGLPA